ncbi:hypothetical protein JTB14_000364 [Gonioctena quinquepunctata]|nr:hypothetical protein JTB14_000364 [Gonioctena quinquepunctata]
MSSGYDEVPTKIIKLCIEEMVYIINNSLKYGIFPDLLKLALVKLILKNGDPSKLENFRPISLLFSFSKIFEAVICKRIINFMEHHNLLSKSQHGYQRVKSTA